MSASTSSQPLTTRRSDTLVHEQIDLGQLSMAHAQSQAAAYSDASSSPGNQTPITSLGKMTIWEIFTSMFQNNETDPVKVTATAVLSRAWSDPGSRYPWSVPFLTSDGKPSSSGDADNTAPPPAAVAPRPRVKITAWRILNTSLLPHISGKRRPPTNLDWMIGVVWALISYWEDPSIAPWFFMTDWSDGCGFGITVFFLALSGGNLLGRPLTTILPVIYGMLTLIFPHPIHWTVAHAILVAIAGLLVQILYNTVRIPPFYDTLFRSSDCRGGPWSNMYIYGVILPLSPVGVTVMLTSEWSICFFLAVAMPCGMIYGIFVVFFGQGAMTMCFRLIRKAYPAIGKLLRNVYRHLRGFDLNTDF
ncbi:hypothetical protein B0H14DRAFT_2746389 [Mycena olivaceomarginata]|nr:hypothetical protein B0H14DRAFT_2746389 [Mycena olivaceomarginata]